MFYFLGRAILDQEMPDNVAYFKKIRRVVHEKKLAFRMNMRSAGDLFEKHDQDTLVKKLRQYDDPVKYAKARVCADKQGEDFHQCIERKCPSCTFQGFFIAPKDSCDICCEDNFFSNGLECDVTLESLLVSKIKLSRSHLTFILIPGISVVYYFPEIGLCIIENIFSNNYVQS